MIDVRRLRVLRELAARGTVAATAEALSYSGPAVSQQLAALEREVGVRLLERDGRRLRLTDAARVLVRHADAVFGQLEAAEADLAALSAEVSGSLRIAAFQSASRTLVAPALGALLTQHPGLELHVDDGEPEEGLVRLRNRDVDLLVSHEYAFGPRPHDDAFERVDLGRDRLSVAVPAARELPAGEIALGDLAGETWIAGQPGTACHDIVFHAARAVGFEPSVRHHTNDFEVVLSLVAAGLGVALVPDLAVPDAAAVLPGVRLDRPMLPLHRRISALVRAGATERPAIRVALAALRAEAGRVGLASEPISV